MKTGFRLYKRYRKALAYINLLRFLIRKYLIGFDFANQLLEIVDKHSIPLILRSNGARISNNCDIETGIVFHNCRNYKNLTIGENSHIGKNCLFDLMDEVIIGSNVVISMNCSFITHIDMGRSALSDIYKRKSGKIRIHNNSYLGSSVTVLKNITIQEGALVAAGALVKCDIPSNQLFAGVPAKFIKNILP